MINIDEIMLTPQEILLNIAKNEKRKRKIKGFTQEKLAERSGVSLGSIRRFEQTGDIAASEGDVDIYYSSFTNKFVPPDYEPTPEEEKQVEEGSLNIGYGSDEITISESEYVSWSDEGITYSILTMDNVLGKDVLVDMAMDIINS